MSSAGIFIRLRFKQPDEAKAAYKVLKTYKKQKGWALGKGEPVLESTINQLEALNIPARHMLTRSPRYFSIEHVSCDELGVNLSISTVKFCGSEMLFWFIQDLRCANLEQIYGYAEEDSGDHMTFLYGNGPQLFQLWCVVLDDAFKAVFPDSVLSMEALATAAEAGKLRPVPVRSEQARCEYEEQVNRKLLKESEFLKFIGQKKGRKNKVKISNCFDYLSGDEDSFCMYE